MPAVDTNKDLIYPQFFIEPIRDEAESKEQGRPIYNDREFVRIRFAANKQTVAVFPAHEVWRWVEVPDGSKEPQTYAMRFPDQYRAFKANEAQTVSGTPLSELPFLTASKRLELKALSIHTAEALAALDGQPLKQLGIGGRELKNQAIAYLANAAGNADVTRFAAENVELRQQMANQQRQIDELLALVKTGKPAAPPPADEPTKPASPFEDWEDEDLRNFLTDRTGTKPKGKPSHATLVQMADEVNDAAKAKEAA